MTLSDRQTMESGMTDTATGRNETGIGEGDFGWALAMLSRCYQAHVTAAIGEIPHGPRGFQVLSTVIRGDQPNQLSIAAHHGIDRTVMTYVIDDLVAAGLVERQPDPNDRRARKIVATTTGHRIHALLQQRVQAAEAKVLGCLPEADQATFRELISRVALSAQHLSPETDSCEVVMEMLEG
jgi:DNA-binding MarR family transcriptional regulator